MVSFAITTISYLYVYYVEDYIKKSSLEQLKSIGSITEDKVDLYIQQMHDKLELFNTRMYLYNKLSEYDKSKDPKIKKIIEKILEFSYLKEKDIINIVILDADSKIIASKLKKIDSTNRFIRSIAKEKKTVQHTKLIYPTDKIMPRLYISSPILKEKKLIGTSIFVIKLAYLNKLLTSDIKIGKTGEIFMGSKNGDKLILFTPLKFSHYPIYCTNRDFNNYISNQISSANEKQHLVQKALDYRKVPVVLSLHYNKTLQAVIVVKKDIQELMAPIKQIKKYQFIILFVTILFIIFSSLIISNSIIKAIKNIVRITSDISKGKLKERINISSKDELGELGKSVNRMADFMVNVNEISEAKVVKQTKLLQESNTKLQEYNQNLSTIIKSLSHDIKTPLTIMNGYLEEIDDGMIQCKEIPQVTSILKRETAYLNELTSEVIGYIQSKEIATNKKESISLKEFLDIEVCPLLRIAKGVQLTYEFDKKYLYYPKKIKQHFLNFYSQESKITEENERVIL